MVITHFVTQVTHRYVFFQENIVTTGLNSGISVIYFVKTTFSRVITATPPSAPLEDVS